MRVTQEILKALFDQITPAMRNKYNLALQETTIDGVKVQTIQNLGNLSFNDQNDLFEATGCINRDGLFASDKLIGSHSKHTDLGGFPDETKHVVSANGEAFSYMETDCLASMTEVMNGFVMFRNGQERVSITVHFPVFMAPGIVTGVRFDLLEPEEPVNKKAKIEA